MDNKQKTKLAEMVINFINDNEEEVKKAKHIGYLNKAQGLNGFKLADIGTPVFESTDRYFIQLETLDGKRNLELEYYKESLKPAIDFL